MKKLELLKTLGVIAVFTILSSTVEAQNDKRERKGHFKKEEFNPDKMAERQTERLSKELSLNEATKAKVAGINKEYSVKMAEIAKIERERREKEREKIKSIHNERENKLKNVLSKEEFAQYEKIKANKKEHFAERRERFRSRRGQRH
jgi:protein CpxP